MLTRLILQFYAGSPQGCKADFWLASEAERQKKKPQPLPEFSGLAHNCLSSNANSEAAMMSVDPLTAVGVTIATAATDAVYVMFISAVVSRQRVAAVTWSSFWYLLSSLP